MKDIDNLLCSTLPQALVANSSSSTSNSNLEKSLVPRKSRLTIKEEFRHTLECVVSCKLVNTIFKGIHLTSINKILEIPISKLRTLSLTPTGKHWLVAIKESEIK